MTTFNFQDLVYFQEWPWILSKQFTNKWVKILNVRNIVNWNLDISNTTTFISEEEAYWKYKHFLIDWDEIIIASSWIKVEYFDKKVCFANKESLPLMLNTSIIRLKSLNEEVLLKWYLYYFLKSQIFKNQIQKLITWSAQLNFWPSHLKQIQIPLPPLSHQKQIIQKLDNLTNLINLRKLSIEKTEKLTKSIFIEMFWDPMINEKGWEVKKLEEYTNLVSSWSTPLWWQNTYFKEWIFKFIRSQNVRMFKLDYEDIFFISEKIHNSMKRTWVKNNDVLFNITWASIWRVAIYKWEDNKANVNQHVCIIRLKDTLNSYFLMYYLWFDVIQANILSQQAWATRQAFNFEQIKNFDILSPPISLQNKFASIVEKNEENIKNQKDSLKKLEELYSGVMQESFRI